MLYLDASALVKRYSSEQGSGELLRAMRRFDRWMISRVGLLEARVAVERACGEIVARRIELERGAFDVIELTEAVERRAGELAARHELRTLDAVHLASALAGMPHFAPVMACWDNRLRVAAAAEGLTLFPSAAP